MKLTKPLVFFDLETTGTDVSKDRIVEIAIIRFNEDMSVYGEGTVFKINPTVPIPKGASDVHGITDESVKDCPTFKDLAETIFRLMEGADLAGYNIVSFDVPLLNEEFSRVGRDFPAPGTKFVDACVIFKQKEQRTLSAASQFYLGKDHEGAHGALADTDKTVQVLKAQMERYNLPESIDELHDISMNGRVIVDFAGKLTLDQSGEITYNFGKHKGRRVIDEPKYGEWVLKSDFSESTKKYVRAALKKEFAL